MKVLIATAQVPFVRGGAEYLADALQRQIEARGHRAEIVGVPFKWYPYENIPRHMLACRFLKLGGLEDADLLIALKFPAYLVPFPRKKLWLLHQFRQVYELWGTPYQDLPNTPEGLRVREQIIQADTRYLREVSELYTNSRTVADRLKRYNGIEATEVLSPPLLRPEIFGPGNIGHYFFYPSRLVLSKRQHLAVEAMRHVRSDFSLVLAGQADDDEYGARLKRLIAQFGLEDRVRMIGWISEEEKARLMADACGVLYLPYEEDSYGYVTLEAFHSHKPVITLRDSGGARELIEDGRNGKVVEPVAESLAAAMESLWADHAVAAAMGREAFATLQRWNISWDYVLERLLS